MSELLEVSNLRKAFGDHQVIEDVSFSVPEGSVTVITPHAGELASALALLGITDDGDEVTREAVEADPVRWARRMADGTGYVVLLKGGATVIARPAQRSADGIAYDRAVFVENRSPNWLATAGTGDVLAGIVGVALAAGIEASAACAVATYIHGRAAHLANPGGPVRALAVAHALVNATRSAPSWFSKRILTSLSSTIVAVPIVSAPRTVIFRPLPQPMSKSFVVNSLSAAILAATAATTASGTAAAAVAVRSTTVAIGSLRFWCASRVVAAARPALSGHAACTLVRAVDWSVAACRAAVACCCSMTASPRSEARSMPRSLS